MAKVIIGFSTSNGPGSAIIRWFMRRPFSHTYFKYKEERYDDHTIFHAVGKGLSYLAEVNFNKHNKVVKEFSLEVDQHIYDGLLEFCHKNSGVKYGFFQNLGIAWVKLLNKVGIKANKNPINDGANCSEVIYYILKSVYGDWIKKEPNLVDPEDCYEYLVKHG